MLENKYYQKQLDKEWFYIEKLCVFNFFCCLKKFLSVFKNFVDLILFENKKNNPKQPKDVNLKLNSFIDLTWDICNASLEWRTQLVKFKKKNSLLCIIGYYHKKIQKIFIIKFIYVL